MTEDEQADVITAAIDDFFREVDVDTFETDDLAWSIVRALRRATTES